MSLSPSNLDHLPFFNCYMHGCQCGFLGHPRRACRCAPSAAARYRNRISGPLIERIDLFVHVPVESKQTSLLWEKSGSTSESTAEVQARILPARRFANEQRGQSKTNSQLDPAELREVLHLDGPAERLMLDASKRWSLSARAVHRTLRVARTVADLSAKETVSADAVAEALAFRHETLEGRGPDRA